MSDVKRIRNLIILVFAAFVALPASADTRVDPTRPPAAPALTQPAGAVESAPRLRLESTLVSSFRRIAIINGERVREGQLIAGARVESIDMNEVVLRANGRELVLKEPTTLDVKQKKGT